MASESFYLRAIMPTLPTDIASKIRTLCTSPANESMLENLVRLLAGAEAAPDSSKATQEQWPEKQGATRKVIASLLPAVGEKKRSRGEDSMEDADSQQSKKQRLGSTSTNGNATPADNGRPLFTLHALSVTSPIRKKVNITAHQNGIVMTNPTTSAIEATIPIHSLRRAFIVPTRGKSKAHWTVIFLSSDIPEKGKPPPGSPENPQVIFGTDATSSMIRSMYVDVRDTVAPFDLSTGKGASLPSLIEFVAHLKIPLIEPTVDVFKSVCPGIGANAGPNGIPGVEAYRAARAGSLWFAKEGILWGESKPCEFWSVEDLLGKSEGVRIVGSGRTCTVILTRRSRTLTTEMEEDDEDLGEETEFGMVDSKEREGINGWVRNHRHLFNGNGGSASKGKEKANGESATPRVQNTGPMTIQTLQDGSDSEDEDFAASDSDDGSQSSDKSSSEDDGGGGADEGGQDEGSEDGEGDIDMDDDEVQELDPAQHPLLRPGAMPKMSKAALEMAVGIVENAFMGADEREEDEEDELDD